MKEKYIVYLILNKSGKLLKIGKTKESFKINRYKKIDEDFKGAQFNNSYYVESPIKAEIDNLERILHKVYYKERKPKYYKTGVGKTEWFNSHIFADVRKHIKYLKKSNDNFKNLSGLKKGIDLESKFKPNYKLRFYIFMLFMFIGFLLGVYLKSYNIQSLF